VTDAIPVIRKKSGRPYVGSVLVGVRVPPEMLAELDAHLATLPHPKPSRPDFLRQLLHEELVRRGLRST
jgi:hypothetical protein